jgi:cytoskeletal protein CcmA (bactofilin family)
MIGKKDKSTTTSTPSALNVIGEGTKIIGDISSDGDLRIDGVVEGNIATKAKCVLGSSSRVTGNIEARNCDISGSLNGNIKISELLLVKSSGKINGDIATAKMVVESGGEFNGSCKMGSSVSISRGNEQTSAKATTA